MILSQDPARDAGAEGDNVPLVDLDKPGTAGLAAGLATGLATPGLQLGTPGLLRSGLSTSLGLGQTTIPTTMGTTIPSTYGAQGVPGALGGETTIPGAFGSTNVAHPGASAGFPVGPPLATLPEVFVNANYFLTQNPN
jgi:hypothetical protein